LPAFIIIALLVNFAPVICGLIVDASNIVMNYFTKEITGAKQLISMLKTLGDTLVEGISWETFKATKQIELVLTLFVLTGVNLVLFLLLLLFALVFAARYMVIWLLVILSPLAFACYILPATRKIWDLWWKQFIQWSIIGITMGFFLYLADQFSTQIPTIDPEFTKGVGGAILPALFPLIFLALGFVFGLTTGAMGTEKIMAGFKKGTTAAGRTATSIGWERARRGAEAVRAEAAMIRRRYQAGRTLGLSRTQAAGETVRRYWQRRALPAIRPVSVVRGTVAAGRGILSTTGAIATSGVRAGLGIRRRGFRRGGCPDCGNPRVAASAIACPTCGHVF
jgi:hypothetical protein